MLREPPPGWFCSIHIGEVFESSDKTKELVEAGATSCVDATVSGSINDLLLKTSQQLECSLEELVQQATTQETLV